MHGRHGGGDEAGLGGIPRVALRLVRRYSRVDRLLHRAAFSSIGLQKSLADLEDLLYRTSLRTVRVERPVFIAGLPRAGTTLLLNVLASEGPFASHTYRHMPFLFTPMLWRAFARPFRVSGEPVERAHGDGMQIGFDSPEAFEEALWRAFWPGKYREDRIEAWTDADASAGEFASFFKSHVAKIVALEETARPGRLRYLSKNNANIVRVPTLLKLFPDAIVLIAFRNPLDQAGSMLRQHARFSAMQASEPFMRRYTADIGHYEFGLDLRPLDFGGGKDDPGPARPEDGGGGADPLDGWLAYWCAAYQHVLDKAAGTAALVDYDALCAQPEKELRNVAAAAGMEDVATLGAAAGQVRPAARRAEAAAGQPGRMEQALRVHRRLLAARRRQSPARSRDGEPT